MAQRKPYNPNTAYGRRKMREEFQHRYHHEMTPEEREENDNGVMIMKAVLVVVCIVIFIIIWNVSGPEAAMKWAK